MAADLTLSVRPRDGVSEYDSHMLSVQQAVQRGNVAELTIPKDISYAGALGRSVSFAQLIATWADLSIKRHIRTPLRSDDHDGHTRFVSRLHGLAAAYFADQITGEDGKTDLRQMLLEAAKPRIRAMSRREFGDVAKGRLTELIFVHHAKCQFHSVAYRREPTLGDLMDSQRHGELIVPPREMNALVHNVLKAQQLPSFDFKRIASLLEESNILLGRLLHEIFRNTAEHAYLDLEGGIPFRSLRCILIAVRYAHPDELHREKLFSFREHPHADQYFKQLRGRANRTHRHLVHILELSVFDTGPGFVATISSFQDKAAKDSDLVAKCFLDHVSSKHGPNSGLGLGRVLTCVGELGGFVRVRTSTTEAFFSSPSRTQGKQPVPYVVGDLPKTTGTVLTVAVPLEL